MIWTYRVCRDRQGRYSIREVYFEQDGTPVGYAGAPALPIEATPADLLQMIEWFRGAFDLPILSLDDMDVEVASNPPSSNRDGSGTVTLQHVLAQLADEEELPVGRER